MGCGQGAVPTAPASDKGRLRHVDAARGRGHRRWRSFMCLRPPHALEAGSLVGSANHGVSLSLYAKDPDGLEFGVFLDGARGPPDGHAGARREGSWPGAPSSCPRPRDRRRRSHRGRDRPRSYAPFNVSGQIRMPAFFPASQSWRSKVASVISAPTASCHESGMAGYVTWRQRSVVSGCRSALPTVPQPMT